MPLPTLKRSENWVNWRNFGPPVLLAPDVSPPRSRGIVGILGSWRCMRWVWDCGCGGFVRAISA